MLSQQAGVTLDGLVCEEPLSAMIKTTVRACTGKPSRDLTTSRMGGLGIGLARHFPSLFDRAILRRMQRLARQGRYQNAPLASGMLKRLGLMQE